MYNQQQIVSLFKSILSVIFSYFQNQEVKIRDLVEPPPLSILNLKFSTEEQLVFLLALMPHISPETLDIFFLKNKDYDIPYTEFGGWKGTSHSGFIPTGQTAAFLLTQSVIMNEIESKQDIFHLLSKDHWFYKENILRCEGQGEGEPFLSGMLRVSDEVLAKVYGISYEPEYNSNFPAKKITTLLSWDDLVLPYNLQEELNDITLWLQHQQKIKDQWQLNRLIKSGYRCLFYGPPGTGKTLTATLLGQQNKMDIYRVDLSMIVSKYIGETEKNLAKVFDKAQQHNWILFFDEADALFGQRTETQSSNDRHANQEVAYLLQRIEDFSGMVILATNLKENLDEAFFRRFQSALYFPMPDQRLRYQLWQKMIPDAWLDENREELLQEASAFNLSGGSMVNVIQTCAVKLYESKNNYLNIEILKSVIKREMVKEGKVIS